VKEELSTFQKQRAAATAEGPAPADVAGPVTETPGNKEIL
jgi:hypothetical protein